MPSPEMFGIIVLLITSAIQWSMLGALTKRVDKLTKLTKLHDTRIDLLVDLSKLHQSMLADHQEKITEQGRTLMALATLVALPRVGS